MKKKLLIVLFSFLPVFIFAQENKNISISKTVIESFQKGEYEKISGYFDDKMKEALPEEKLKMVWNDLNTKCGKFQKYSDITTDTYQIYDINYLLCHFEKMNLKMKLVYDEKHRIAGLFFVPEDQK